MTAAAIAWLSVAGYFLAAVLLSRPIYGRIRANSIDAYFSKRYNRGDRMEDWESLRKSDCLMGTALLALFWPVVMTFPAFIWLSRWTTGSKIRSNREIEQEKRFMRERISTLEQELGIK